jgi:hypothetical protein
MGPSAVETAQQYTCCSVAIPRGAEAYLNTSRKNYIDQCQEEIYELSTSKTATHTMTKAESLLLLPAVKQRALTPRR